MKDPKVLRTMENFQRYLERDRDVGYSFSLTDILRAVNMVFHELEPKWGVIPNNSRDVAQTFFIFFSGSPPTETAKYVDPSYTTSHVTFFSRHHTADTVAAMAVFEIGINVNTLPLVTVGVGFGIDYGLYILSRIIEEIRVNNDLDLSIREALTTSGKAVSFTAVCMIGGTALWTFSNI